ncbi:MFS general substrate transporter [Tilletiaria anomala UBC 951]|uniref:MFS general substrate transporter n=1 Tax=Tilletiaria anomala (strain ATCC 24038 / CBS 436.72 / UBC 951) TaxID=1037660 RepID=A0A066V8C2_TILAU|nr:MFS general substrate transporter [Tilletiaria anomala UBC 951]KDN37982.1 MFS general substrate transporter [Tilletiaria anomala UBC 951]
MASPLQPDHASEEKRESLQLEERALDTKDIQAISKAGHAATDDQGHVLVQFDQAAERRLTRKIDLRVIPMMSLLYAWTFIDRANIGNARLSTLEADLGLRGLEYNHLLSIFYIFYAIFEIPCTILCKVIGPHRFIPAMAFLFGLATMCSAFVTSFGNFIPVRIALALGEASVFPGIAYYFSRWYRKDEMALRLSLYVVCAPLAGALSGLLASAILVSPSMGPIVVRWRQIFLIEGLISIVVAVATYLVVPANIETAKFLNEEEKALALARIKSENVATTEVVEGLELKPLWNAMKSFTTITIALIFLFDNIAAQSLGFFTPTVVRTLFPGRTTVQLQLLTVPPYIVGAISTVLLPYLSGRFKRRGPFFLLASLLMILGYAIFVGNARSEVKFAALFVSMAGAFPLGAFCNAWAIAQVTSDSARNGAIALVVFFGNLGGVASTWTFQPSDAPLYLGANSAVLSFSVAIFVLSAATMLYIYRQNKARDESRYQVDVSHMSQEEISRLGPRHPAFRYRP